MLSSNIYIVHPYVLYQRVQNNTFYINKEACGRKTNMDNTNYFGLPAIGISDLAPTGNQKLHYLSLQLVHPLTTSNA